MPKRPKPSVTLVIPDSGAETAKEAFRQAINEIRKKNENKPASLRVLDNCGNIDDNGKDDDVGQDIYIQGKRTPGNG